MLSIVELQNGSIVRGVILESADGTIKIQTADQSVFVYDESDVKAITATEQEFKKSGLDGRGPKVGKYRGFVDVGYSKWVVCTKADPLELETSHGFQLLNWLYFGAGVGVHYRGRGRNMVYNDFLVPVFADVRVDFINHSLTPFVDLRGGTEIAPKDIGNGTYLNPMVGCRIALKSVALNISVGYTYRQVTASDSFYNQCAEVTFKAGIEF